MTVIKEGEPVPWAEYRRVHQQVGDLTLAVGILVKRELDRLNFGSERQGEPMDTLTVSRRDGLSFAPGESYIEIGGVMDKMTFKIGNYAHEQAEANSSTDDGQKAG